MDLKPLTDLKDLDFHFAKEGLVLFYSNYSRKLE